MKTSLARHGMWCAAAAGVAALCAAALHLNSAAPRMPAVSQNANPAVSSEFTPSRYPGGMVRDVTRAAVRSTHASSSIYVEPGTSRSSIARLPRRKGIRLRKGVTAAGGNIVNLDKSMQPLEHAGLTPSGEIRFESAASRGPLSGGAR